MGGVGWLVGCVEWGGVAACPGRQMMWVLAGRRSRGRTNGDISHEAFANDEGLDAFSINQMCDVRKADSRQLSVCDSDNNLAGHKSMCKPVW